MHAHVETEECSEKPRPDVFLFRQQVKELDHRKDEKSRIELISALYNPNKNAIFSQIEFITRPSRKSMIERARALTESILKASVENQVVADPFLHPAATMDETLPKAQELASPDDAYDADDHIVNDALSTRSLGVYVGMERFSQLGFSETFLRSRELVVTRSIMTLGANYVERLSPYFLFDLSVRGGVAPLELLRPLAQKKLVPQKLTKMLDLTMEFATTLPIASLFQLNFGLVLSGLFFDSDIHERVPLAPMWSYWQFKEGITVSGTVFLSVFDTTLSLLSGYFPFVQNSSIGTRKPFSDYGWHIGFCVESTVYRWFGLKFHLTHRRELFDGIVSERPLRVVSQGTLAYLGLVGRF